MSTRTLLEKLMNDARRLRLGQKLPEGPLPWELVQRIQADLATLMKQSGATMEQIANSLGDGYSRATISRIKNLKSLDEITKGLDRAIRGLNQFMETIGRRMESARPEGYVETEVARKILVLIAKTLELCSIGVIYSDAGRGKTLTLKAAAMIHPGSVLIRVIHSSRTPSGLARHIARALQIRGADTTLKAQIKIIEKLRGTGRVLLIDEAHQLRHESLEMLRDLHDEAGIPIVLAGTVKLNDAVSDNDLFYGQFTSRVALRYDVTEELQGGVNGNDPKPLHTVDEIRRLYESDKVRLTSDGRLLLTRIANLPGLGGLRLCAKIVQVSMAAANGNLVDAKLILQVVRALLGQSYATAHIERPVERSRIQIA